MGWGQVRRPSRANLNHLTRRPANIVATYDFFVSTYGSNGMGNDKGTRAYEVGDLCHDITAADAPWPTIDQDDRERWKMHCQDGGKGDLPAEIRDDLTKWIREAILAKRKINYNWTPKRHDVDWTKKRVPENGVADTVNIFVTGPGF